MMMIIITSLLDVKVRLVNIYGAFRTYCIIIARFFCSHLVQRLRPQI